MARRPFNWFWGFGSAYDDTLGINAGTFRNMQVGCLGAVLMVLFTAGAILGLVYMVWWMVAHNAAAQ